MAALDNSSSLCKAGNYKSSSKIRCEALLLEASEAVRACIENASLRYAASHSGITASLLRGSEASRLGLIDEPNGHMIYLASGADIHRPLYDFPLITHYHMVDVLVGWGKNPSQGISEMTRRLQELHPTANVKIVHKGFLEFLDEKDLSHSYKREAASEFIKNKLSDPRANAPLILSVDWKAEQNQKNDQQKFFYLHPDDFDNAIKMKALLGSIPKAEPLVGVLEAGWSVLPTPEVFDQIMNGLHKSGSFIFESWETIGFDPEAERELFQKELNNSYRVDVSLPTPDVQKVMADSDILKMQRISFEFIISRNHR